MILSFSGALIRVARFDHQLKRLLLILDVASAGLDEFGQFIVTLFEKDIDVGPRLVDIVLQLH